MKTPVNVRVLSQYIFIIPENPPSTCENFQQLRTDARNAHRIRKFFHKIEAVIGRPTRQRIQTVILLKLAILRIGRLDNARFFGIEQKIIILILHRENNVICKRFR